jgi:radical SAM superfamily enzyme YgiQ (UPF0313 family)
MNDRGLTPKYNRAVHVLLISTYDVGRQPFGLASPAAWLKRAGLDVVCADLAKDRLEDAAVAEASLIAFFLPMHTATRLAVPVIDRVRALNPDARLAAYGLYAPLNAALLRDRGVTHVLGGEFEQDLVDVATMAAGDESGAGLPEGAPNLDAPKKPAIPRLSFLVPVRDGLPPLSKYATLQIAGERRIAGYTEASRGCKHRCRHCPIVPVYDGRFRTVAVDVVLGDVRAQVAAGARHITFGDPDFFNGIRHAEAVITGMSRQFPGVTYDVTIKIEHLLKHAGHLPLLRDTGCAFVTSAVESIDDDVLAKLEKGHTRADFEQVVALFRDTPLPLSATFVPFSPWTTIESYLDLLHVIDALDLVENVAPVQFVVRLLIPEGSRMLELPVVRALTTGFDATSLTYPWAHRDPSVDALHTALTEVVSGRLMSPRREVFARIWEAAHQHAGVPAPERRKGAPAGAAIPSLNEPWYCCAEPTAEQLARI